MFITGSQRVSVPKKGSFEATLRIPLFVRADFFRSDHPLPPVEPRLPDSTYPQKMPFRTSVKNDAESLKTFVWRELICMNDQHISIETLVCMSDNRFFLKTTGLRHDKNNGLMQHRSGTHIRNRCVRMWLNRRDPLGTSFLTLKNLS